jgi:K+-sensing histidine kinase KdpD
MAFDFTTLLSAELHDIKNQMQALLSVQEDLAEELVGQDQYQPSLDKIQQHSKALNYKLIEMLSILKIQHQSFEPSENEHWLIDTLEPITREFANLHGMNFKMDFDTDFNAFYDEQLLQIALHNAFMNANQAGAHEFILQVQEFDDASWLIKIKDDGAGFNPEQLSKGEFSPHGTKNGLGLYLIEQAIKAHKRNGKSGSITIKNNPDQGACVELFFP